MGVIAALLVGDVDPVVGAGGGGFFPDELVVGDVGAEPVEPFAACLLVGDVDVGGFARHVLGGFGAAYCLVKGWGAVAAGDGDGAGCVGAEGFEDVEAELLEIADGLNGGDVGDASCCSGGALGELA